MDNGDHLGLNESIKAVCFPAGCAMASSFNMDIVEKIGKTLGKECKAANVAVLLGPGINIKRSPLCGRNFEYYSENPYLAGKIGTAMVKGIQSEGISSCVKHFAANNQESYRMSGNLIVDERTLNEIYLTPFEMVVKDAKPTSFMCAYNQINGTFASENKYLLTDKLTKTWGFDGMVVTDWGAAKDPIEGVKAGVDLIMPGGNQTYTKKLVDAVKFGQLDEAELDKRIQNILNLVEKNKNQQSEYDWKLDYEMAKSAALECAVLLKNSNQVLPLSKDENVVFIGDFVKNPRYQGSGSSHINSNYVSNVWEHVQGYNVSYSKGFSAECNEIELEMRSASDRALANQKEDELIKEAVKKARMADKAVLFIGLPDAFETEAVDRTNMNLPENQNRLVQEVLKVQPNTIVVLHNGAPIQMPWADKVTGILEMYLCGDGCGEAAAELLYGKKNPSGKLAESFPVKLSDTSSFLNFPGIYGTVEYKEGIYVGYRYLDKKEMNVLFPFGYGLSYTTFEYSDLRLSKVEMNDNEKLIVNVSVTNTGECVGKEIVQLYIESINSSVPRPIRELKGFEKIELQPGEIKTISFELGKRAFAYYETEIHDFTVSSGIYQIEIGASSRDIRLRELVNVSSTEIIPKQFTRNSTMGEVLSHPRGQAIIGKYKSKQKQNETKDETMGAGGNVMMWHMEQEMTLGALQNFAGLSENQLDKIIIELNRSDSICK